MCKEIIPTRYAFRVGSRMKVYGNMYVTRTGYSFVYEGLEHIIHAPSKDEAISRCADIIVEELTKERDYLSSLIDCAKEGVEYDNFQ